MSKFLYMLGTLVLEHMKREAPKPIYPMQLVWACRYDVDERCPIPSTVVRDHLFILRNSLVETTERELR